MVARPVLAIRAGMLIRRDRMVLVRALANCPPASTPAALVRLQPMSAQAGQAPLAFIRPDGSAPGHCFSSPR
jgi:hypothetical protein